MDCDITASALSVFWQPRNLETSSLFLSNLDTEARACKCCEPLLLGAKSKNIMSTGWSSFALKSNPDVNIAIKPFGFLIESYVAWGIAIPLPTAVEPNFSLLSQQEMNSLITFHLYSLILSSKFYKKINKINSGSVK